MGYETKAEYEHAAIDLVCECDGRRPGVRKKNDSDGRSYYVDTDSGEFGVKGSQGGVVTHYNVQNPAEYFARRPGIEKL
ncbi:hypothetical protein [Actinokineospora sp.]|uniref:hypothetical protein n=1 Tax=Actinokineospora sp. TaxID=1872133 RepID=UPI00403796BF